MQQFQKFILSWNSTCFGQFVCPSSGVYSLYTQQWYMSYRFVDSCRAGLGWNCSSILVLLESCLQTCMSYNIAECTVQWINSWGWTDELSETCRVSWQNKFVNLAHLVGFITKKFVTMHGHMNVKLGKGKTVSPHTMKALGSGDTAPLMLNLCSRISTNHLE